jgi:predicted amidophosphoribosyltransferase
VDCKNCHKPLNDSQNFCDECGAKIIHNRLTPKVLLQQVNEQFLSIDNKLLRTFIDLFKKPDNVINGYINGTRKNI